MKRKKLLYSPFAGYVFFDMTHLYLYTVERRILPKHEKACAHLELGYTYAQLENTPGYKRKHVCADLVKSLADVCVVSERRVQVQTVDRF